MSEHTTPEALRALIDRWMNEGARCDSFHATMGIGWKGAARELAALLDGAQAQASAYVPNAWVCSTCGFVLVKSVLRAADGAVGADTREVQDICSNDGTSLRRQTWQEHAEGLAAITEKLLAERAQAQASRDAGGEQDGANRIAAERARQISAEGWTPEHDDTHMEGEMIEAARGYLSAAFLAERGRKWIGLPPSTWPWNQSWWKPSGDPVRDLVRAGALIAAEIDRLQRAAPSTTPPFGQLTPHQA